MENIFYDAASHLLETDGISNELLSLHVAQLPYKEHDRWLALSDDEFGNNNSVSQLGKGEKLSVVTLFSGSEKQFQDLVMEETNNMVSQKNHTGLVLLIDQWNEVIPEKTINTGLCFNYNAPNTQPPQTWLLAVPAKPEEDERTLADIVSNATNMTKSRAIDNNAHERKSD